MFQIHNLNFEERIEIYRYLNWWLKKSQNSYEWKHKMCNFIKTLYEMYYIMHKHKYCEH